jgi:hypothetical protein
VAKLSLNVGARDVASLGGENPAPFNREDSRMTQQDEKMYRLGYADAMAGSPRGFEHHLAYLAGYRDGLADKTSADGTISRRASAVKPYRIYRDGPHGG